MDFAIRNSLVPALLIGRGMDYLVLLDNEDSSAVLGGRATIVHAASPRLFVVRLESASREELAELPGVAALAERSLPPELTAQLDPQEKLFAAAFAAREDGKKRVGDGLPWDAAGFEPPDPPAGTGGDTADSDTTCSESSTEEGGITDEQ